MKSTGNRLQASGPAIYESAVTRKRSSTTKKSVLQQEKNWETLTILSALQCTVLAMFHWKASLLYKTGYQTSYLFKCRALSQLFLSWKDSVFLYIQRFIPILCKEYLLYAHWLHPLTSALIVVANWRGAAVHVHVSCTSKPREKFSPVQS